MGLYNNEREIRRDIREKFVNHPCDWHKELAESIGEIPDFDSRDWGNNAYDFPAPSNITLKYDKKELEKEIEAWNQITNAGL